ncbi:ABC transporter permease [Methanotrichaceae archaeon M04Ac]|uniref:ABC transporter permease n=1 Tax=Candidatus Methanocrinis alkalitolerans TaxID=3033395 RepID=A0ABT5XHQ5_9EURY|nr:ABC transporter permease [Candidatus Methanocrinis alkalitolerans]MCR3883664.1 ABC transporter permease [Methanothrix sp.]MDF0594027.1 ABC transporter permease [Candidatus Methanocrinis alkalitolerans]
MHVSVWREVAGSNLGRAGLLLIGAMVLLAIFAPILTPYAPRENTSTPAFSRPSEDHWLGTNDARQDIWTQLLYGARTSLSVAFGVALLSGFISVLIGGTAAIFGGLYDRFWMRVVDATVAIPDVIVIILVAAYLRPNVFFMILLLSALSWPGGARVIRAQTLTLKERMHVSASRTFGAGPSHILLHHIIPDLGPVLVATMIQDARRAVFMEAGLSFLGISDPSMMSWGKMMQYARVFTYLEVWKWWLLPTGIALSITLIGLSFIGFALESALDPRLREREKGHDGGI